MITFFRKIKTLTPLEGYNRWSETYHTEDNPIKQLSDEFIKCELPDLKGKSVLDAGCGTGKFCKVAIDQGAAFVRGIDLSPKMIEQARNNCSEAFFKTGDLAVDSINEKYDVIICGLVLGHIDSLKSAMHNLLNALSPGGHLILTDFHPHQTIRKAKRTFSHHGKTFEVKHNLHDLVEFFTYLKDAHVDVVTIIEPRFNNTPVIFGIHGIRS